MVAVPIVRTVEVPRHQEIRVLAVRDDGVPASCAVPVGGRMASTTMALRARLGVGLVHGEAVVVHVAGVGVVDVPVVEVVHVALVLEPRVPAVQSMLMDMLRVGVARLHQGTVWLGPLYSPSSQA